MKRNRKMVYTVMKKDEPIKKIVKHTHTRPRERTSNGCREDPSCTTTALIRPLSPFPIPVIITSFLVTTKADQKQKKNNTSVWRSCQMSNRAGFNVIFRFWLGKAIEIYSPLWRSKCARGWSAKQQLLFRLAPFPFRSTLSFSFPHEKYMWRYTRRRWTQHGNK